MVKRIYTASHHSFVEISRVDDDLHGPMFNFVYRHPEVDIEHRFTMTRERALELARAIQDAAPWMDAVPCDGKHQKQSPND